MKPKTEISFIKRFLGESSSSGFASSHFRSRKTDGNSSNVLSMSNFLHTAGSMNRLSESIRDKWHATYQVDSIKSIYAIFVSQPESSSIFCGPIIESIKISNIISLIKKTCGLIIFFCFFFSKLISFLVPRSKVSWWESLSDRVQTASDRNEKIAIFMLRTEQLLCWVEEQLWASISLLLRNNIPGTGSSPAGCEESSDD